MSITLSQAEKDHLTKGMNGYVYVQHGILNFQGDNYTLHTDYYLIKDNQTYYIERDGSLYKGDFNLLNIKASMRRVKKYNAERDKNLKSSMKEVDYKFIQEMFKAPRKK